VTIRQPKLLQKAVMDMYGGGYVSRGAKHIDLRYHIVREMVSNNTISVKRVCTGENTADTFTKPLSKIQFTYHRSRLPVLSREC
jgi:hypothetical protein